MNMKSTLVDGNIPANSACPFRGECEIAQGGHCVHLGVEHSVPFSCAAARGFEACNGNPGSEEATLRFDATELDSHGLHLVFSAAITEANFLQACTMAIAEAKRVCVGKMACAVNFTASGVRVQVVESSDAETQMVLWKRTVEHRSEVHHAN
ncbi:hypothetical protein [Ottowia sp.]|uniref:hypothetical protein n=1 Tax=Ottowia sp. TaxID=1898956 RepID=UPI0025E648E2|nr:hypothetical protein [Ottowia sp.]MBK6616401.1 hypothetical protein [Ottowia sp.]